MELALMENDGSKPQVCEYLNQVIAASDRAAKLTRQLLSFSRKQVMQCQPLNLNEVIANLSSLLSRNIGEDIQLRYSYSANLPLVSADPGMMEQVILNLVVNARDAIYSGGELTISTAQVCLNSASARTHSEARSGRFACLTVEDTGCGIAPEHLPRIFEPFFTTKEAGKGVGLGLATVHGIIKQHQGWIQVESRQGVGSRFVVFLPALETDTRALGQQPQDMVGRGGTETIRPIED
jgi:signal transduction histidine kinase